MAKEESYWQAQSDCCDYCADLDGKTTSELEGLRPPAHPNCKCEMSDGSISASEHKNRLTDRKIRSDSNSMHLFRAPAIQLSEGKDGKAPEKIQLMRVGTFKMSDGSSVAITPEMLKTIEANFKAGVRRIDVAIDYKHDNENIAAGWVKSVSLSEDGQTLWGDIDWTPKGGQVVIDKEFRYFSPEFRQNYRDNETMKAFGPVLMGGGLTNRPIIKGMEPVIQLSEGAEIPSPKPGPAKPKEKPAMSPMDPAAVDSMDLEQLKALCKDLMGKVSASEQAKVAAETKCAQMEGAAQMAEKTAKFDKMLSEGKVCAAQKEAYLAGDVVKFSELAQPMNPAARGTGAAPSDTAITTKEDAQKEILKLVDVKMSEKKAKTRGDALSLVLAERKDLSKLARGESA